MLRIKPCLALLAMFSGSAIAQCVVVSPPGGSGCGWSTPFGIPTVACNSSPQIGNQTFAVTANVPCPMSAAVLMLGACRTTPVVIRGPFGVGGFCGPAEAVCALFIDPLSAITIPGVARTGGAIFAMPVPNDPTLAQLMFCAQELNLCTMTGGACLGASNTISIRLI